MLVLLIMEVKAQDNGFQTIFNRPLRISGMGGPFMHFSVIDGQFAHFMGGGGGVIINDFVFGGYGQGTTNMLTPKDLVYYDDLELEFGFGGLMFGYTFLSNRAVHPAVYLHTGWGDLEMKDYRGNTDIRDNVFVLMPSLEVEFNFARFFKLGAGACYRFASDVDMPLYKNSDFGGPGAFLSFRFGWF